MQGLGTVGGFKLYVEDRAGAGFEELYSQLQAGMAKGRSDPSLAGVFSSFQVSVPQIDADVDRERVKSYGVGLTDVFETLQVYLGSLYVNDFNRFGRTYQVNAQAESAFRLQPEQIRRLRDAQRARRHGAARIARDGDARLRTRSGDALQRLSGGRDQRRAGAGLQLRPGAGRRSPARSAISCRRG